jgi:hypothetical protein
VLDSTAWMSRSRHALDAGWWVCRKRSSALRCAAPRGQGSEGG